MSRSPSYHYNLVADIPPRLRTELIKHIARDWIPIATELGFEPSRFTCCTPSPGSDPNTSFAWMLMNRLVESMAPLWPLRSVVARLRFERNFPGELLLSFQAPLSVEDCSSDPSGVVTIATQQSVHRYQGAVAAPPRSIQLPRVKDIHSDHRAQLSRLLMSFLEELADAWKILFPVTTWSVMDLWSELANRPVFNQITLSDILLERIGDMTIERLVVCVERVRRCNPARSIVCDNTEETIRLLGYFPRSDPSSSSAQCDIIARLPSRILEPLAAAICPIIQGLASECEAVNLIQNEAHSTDVFILDPLHATRIFLRLVLPMRVPTLCLYIASVGIRVREFPIAVAAARNALSLLGCQSYVCCLDANHHRGLEQCPGTPLVADLAPVASLPAPVVEPIIPAADCPASIEKAPESVAPGPVCSICIDAPQELAVVPCGHLCMCIACSKGVTKCPICRVVIQSTMRIYSA